MALWPFTSCAPATTITLEIRADIDVCEHINEVGIASFAAASQDDSSEYPLRAFTKKCSSGRVGTLVLVPHDSDTGSRNERTGIRVVAGLYDKSSNACDDPNAVVAPNCIIAKRIATFVEGANVPITVTLSDRCAHVSCSPGYTCNPDEVDPAKRCIPPSALGNLDDGSNGSRPPIDAGP